VHKMTDGEFRQQLPSVYQGHGRTRKPVATRFTIRGQNEIGFDLASYDRTQPLVIDPQIIYSTYEGGSGNDAAIGIAADAAGNTYVTGWTESMDFPGSAWKIGSGHGVDAFVAKTNPAGTALMYLTYLGASGEDRGVAIALDGAGSAIVTGWTYSSDFPTANPVQGSLAGGRDVFLAKLSAAGNALMFSTFWGGRGYESGNALAMDASNNAYLTGETDSASFPLLNSYQSSIGGGKDCFVTKFNSIGAVQYSTYIGGRGNETCTGVAVDTSGNAYITGGTDSTNFPVMNAFQPNNAGGQDAFVTKLNSGGNALMYSTYVGGSGGVATMPEAGSGIAVDGSGKAYVTGTTPSTNFPWPIPCSLRRQAVLTFLS